MQRELACMARFPESLTGKGMLGRWKSACKQQGWRYLPQDIAAKYKETPNWIRASCGAFSRKGPGADLQMPEEITKEFDAIMTSRIHGLGPNRKAHEVLRNRNFWKAMSNLRARYNARVLKSNAEAREHLQQQHQRWKDGEITRDAFLENFKLLRRTLNTNVTRTWVNRYKAAWGWSSRKYSAPPGYLPYDHPHMKAWRIRYHGQLERHNVDIRLLLNYDQIWRMVYRGPKTQVFKQRGHAGSKPDPLQKWRKRKSQAQEVARARHPEHAEPAEPAARPHLRKLTSTPKGR